MIKKNLKMLLVTSIVILLPIFAGLILWEQLPAQIPSHWNMEGEIDGYTPKALAVFGAPLLLLILHWFTVFVTISDPKKQNHSQKILHLVFWLIPVLSIVLSAITYSAAMGKGVRIALFVSVLLGLLFIMIGNYLPKCRQNYTVGIKLPWTLHSEENWNRTHRLAGWIWVVGGFAIIVSGFFDIMWITITAPLVMAIVPTVYSYILYRKNI